MTTAENERRPVKRRARGTMKNPVSLTYSVEEASKRRFETIAARSGMTGAVFFEQVVEHLELTDQGIPPWVPPLDRDGELEAVVDHLRTTNQNVASPQASSDLRRRDMAT